MRSGLQIILVAGALLVSAGVLAWADAGREPVHEIVQFVPLPDAPSGSSR